MTSKDKREDELKARIQKLEQALSSIKVLTSWPENRIDHRLPVVRDAHKLACAALAGEKKE